MTGRVAAIVNQRFVRCISRARIHRPPDHTDDRSAGGAGAPGGIPVSLTATVVGIVPNLRQRDFQLPDPDPIAYLPFRTDPRGFMNLL